MKSRRMMRVPAWVICPLLLTAMLITARLASAQEPSRIVGTITAVSGSTLTVQADAGQVYQVNVPSSAVLKRVTPGQRSLAGAETIGLGELAAGDRALVRINPQAPAGALQASEVIAVKLTDIQRKRQLDRAQWRLNGVGGVVRSVNSARGVIRLTSRAGVATQSITVRTTPTTILKRYAPDSLRFDLAQPAPFSSIHVGDQLIARGVKNADGTEVTAEEVVSGSFRHIAGAITSLNTGNSTLVVKDLATRKQVTIHVQPDTQMRRLSDRVARILAARLKSEASGGAPAQQTAGEVGTQFLLRRAPLINLAQLHKGETVMLVATAGTSEVNAITLLAGVEPLLIASEASRQDLLSSWSMDTSAGGPTEAPQENPQQAPGQAQPPQ